MNGKLFKSALVCSSLLLGWQAHAGNGNGTVHFTGEIIDSTCEVTAPTQTQTVDLGKVNKSAFSGAGSTASVQAFQIDLENCPDTYKKATAQSVQISTLMARRHCRSWLAILLPPQP